MYNCTKINQLWFLFENIWYSSVKVLVKSIVSLNQASIHAS